jgi:hypothetical protein
MQTGLRLMISCSIHALPMLSSIDLTDPPPLHLQIITYLPKVFHILSSLWGWHLAEDGQPGYPVVVAAG